MVFKSINPYTNEVIAEYSALDQNSLQNRLRQSEDAFFKWRKTSFDDRAEILLKLSSLLKSNATEHARMISLEMGKPITEAIAEINKCAWVCEYYADQSAGFLSSDVIHTDASISFIRHDPLGPVFGIMPWNFPFWQVFRFAAPTLMAGNTVLLKHAPNVFGCAKLIENLFLEAGMPSDVFQSLIIHHDLVESIIASPIVRAVTLTGSEVAGRTVGALAGSHLKRCVLELGGSNAFVVLEDADLDLAVRLGIIARFMNAGQSCIAAKRFIVHERIYDLFIDKFTNAAKNLKFGNPLDPATQIGPMARIDLAENLEQQMKESIKMGAKIRVGGSRNMTYFDPTVLESVRPEMRVFKEETFGPLAAMIKVNVESEAIKMAKNTPYGLGLSIITKDVERALSYSEIFRDGALFINELVKSDPRLPFGGEGISGVGRELGKDGILAFVNRKTVFVK
jgi:succinate-semialdehyde dehydrogenase/glutarate-semialdehyde dehydrogenase